MLARLLLPSMTVAAGCLVVTLGVPFGEASAQWTIDMRAMRNPLPVGQCTAVEVVVKDAQGRLGPPRPDGKQVSVWDFDFSVMSSAPDAFGLQNGDPTRPFICAQAPTAAMARFTAHYPGRQLQPNQVVPGVELWNSIEVAMEGAAYPNAGYAGGTAPSGGYATGSAPNPGPPSGGYPSGGYPATGGYPGGYPQTDPGSATGPGPAGAYPSGGYPAGGAADPAQTSAYPPGAGYPPAPGYPPAAPAQQGQPAAAPTAPAESGGIRTGKQFLQRIAGHAKRKASEVASNTTSHVADAAGNVVGTTLEAGSDVVKSGAGAVTGAASKGVQGVGQSLGAAPAPKDPADVAATLAAGRAVLYGLRFTEGTAMLEPSSGPLISQIAGALARTPGQFLIEAHVDGKNGAAAQALSEQRAAAVKAALVAAGSSPMQLAAVGYGAARPIAGAKSSARIEIARAQ